MMRRGIAAGAALTIALLSAMPMETALAMKPFREQIRGFIGDDEVAPAGEPCSFAVGIKIEGQGINWQFSPERGVSNNQGDFTFTNLDTGTSYVHRSRYHITSDWMAGRDTVHEVADGKYFLGFLPGDQGPEGEVGRGGAWYFISGRFWWTYDPGIDLITSFDWTGRLQDACQVLSA